MSQATHPVTLLSETDVKGRIIFANEAFCRVSKYPRNELIGMPHNIIRHPDMPAQLFKLLWETIRNGDTFRAVIKNRAKDDSHYWVNATIMGYRNDDNEVEKYIAVRHLIPNEKLARELFDSQARILKL